MSNTVEKIEQIHQLINEIGAEDPAVGNIMLEGFGISMNVLRALIETNGRRDTLDLTEQIEFVSKALGFDLEVLVKHILDTKFATEMSVESNKEPDQETIDFITSDLDDYEKFLAENKAKESLDFLSKEL